MCGSCFPRATSLEGTASACFCLPADQHGSALANLRPSFSLVCPIAFLPCSYPLWRTVFPTSTSAVLRFCITYVSKKTSRHAQARHILVAGCPALVQAQANTFFCSSEAVLKSVFWSDFLQSEHSSTPWVPNWFTCHTRIFESVLLGQQIPQTWHNKRKQTKLCYWLQP